MSSKILRSQESGQAEPIEWRPLGRPGGTLPATQAEPDAAAVAESAMRQECERLLARCRELEQQLPIREEAGRQAGLREAEAAQQARWQAALEVAARSCADLAGLRGRLRREAEQDVVRLSLAIARRILHRELSVDPEALTGLVKVALERIEVREVHRIRVRPEDAALTSRLLERIGSSQRIEVAADASLERGAVIFETQRGDLDASIETQLEEIERGFADILRRQGQ